MTGSIFFLKNQSLPMVILLTLLTVNWGCAVVDHCPKDSVGGPTRVEIPVDGGVDLTDWPAPRNPCPAWFTGRLLLEDCDRLCGDKLREVSSCYYLNNTDGETTLICNRAAGCALFSTSPDPCQDYSQ